MAYIILESDIITLEGPHSSDSKATHEYTGPMWSYGIWFLSVLVEE